MYKRLLAQDSFSRRDLIFAQAAFYAGARSTLKVLDHLLEQGILSPARMRLLD